MATKSAVVPTISPSFGESFGITVREAIDAESGVVRGYKAASVPVLVEARKEANALRTAALTAKLLNDLKG